MPGSPMVGARVPQDWQQQIQAIATASGRKEAEVVREAIAQYLGRTDPSSVFFFVALQVQSPTPDWNINYGQRNADSLIE